MTQLTRRRVLTGAVAASTATALAPIATAPRAHAAAPLSGRQAPGFYRYKLGDFEVTVVTDGMLSFPLPANLVTNANKDDVNAALEAAYMPRDVMTIYSSPIVVNTGSSSWSSTPVLVPPPRRCPTAPPANSKPISQSRASTPRRSTP